MEINDEKRREVAEKMREYDVAEFKESAIVPFIECLGHGYKDWRGILDELADLIERPTCRLDHTDTEPATDGYPVRLCECSNCGRTCDEIYGEYEYCPHCGAEVKHDDQRQGAPSNCE